MIILLDGSKGAGKSTAAKLLCEQLDNATCLSLDNERHLISNKEETIQERNNRAFEAILNKSTFYIKEKKNIIIDCGLIAERVPVLEKLAEENKVPLYKFLLKASYDTQLERVRVRDTLKNKETDTARFEQVHESLYNKSFENFVIIETDKNSPEEVVSTILKEIE